ncbi:MAG: hypothetical protein ACI8P3_002088 [Saprospiraceae bacterium]|jgi:hypothetical protein
MSSLIVSNYSLNVLNFQTFTINFGAKSKNSPPYLIQKKGQK